eukprot:2804809-Prymnesium_polylepis.1
MVERERDAVVDHRVEAAVGARVGEDDIVARHVGDRRSEHRLEVTVEGRREERARPVDKVVRLPRACGRGARRQPSCARTGPVTTRGGRRWRARNCKRPSRLLAAVGSRRKAIRPPWGIGGRRRARPRGASP